MDEERWCFEKVGSIAEEGRDLLENYSGVPTAQVIDHVLSIVCPFLMLLPGFIDPYGGQHSISVTGLSKSILGHALVRFVS